MNRRRAFVLILILTILATLSLIAVMFLSQSRGSKRISDYGLMKSQSRLLARSGFEAALGDLRRGYTADLNTAHRLEGVVYMSTLDTGHGRGDCVRAFGSDATGKIFVNDGMLAGQLELGADYDPRALDPWPGGVVSQDVSAWINLRLRRVLNAYGDVHRFVDQLGWPEYRKLMFSGGSPYGQSLSGFTSTAAGDRFASQPGSSGLGDWIIAARPDAGWNSVYDLEEVVTGWATQHGGFSQAYLNAEGGFFNRIQEDLTVRAWEDTQFFRLTRELGPDEDANGWADYQNDFTQSIAHTMPVDRDPPDLRDLWRPHAVAPVNLNTCSDEIRAALFYAPANVSYVAEGVDIFYHNTMPAGDSGIHHLLFLADHIQCIPTLGVAGPTFDPTRLTENGLAAVVQKNRLMSLRDALMLSQAYRELSLTGTEGWPQSFNQFRILLHDIEKTYAPIPERAKKWTAGQHVQRDLRTPIGQCHFTQHYLSRTLPAIFSCVRRLPGWLHAPAAMLDPVIQEGGGRTRDLMMIWLNSQVEWPRPEHVLRSAEDFVYRSPLPKACFTPMGMASIRSVGSVTLDGSQVESRIDASVQQLEVRVWRTQAEFLKGRTDVPGHPTRNIVLGPEPGSDVSSAWLGVIGPDDRDDDLPTSATVKYESSFEEMGMTPSSETTLFPQDPDADPWIRGALATAGGIKSNTYLRGSRMEDASNSMFLETSRGCDLSPFGGLSFSSRGHGVRAPGVFNDSLYLRPTDVMTTINPNDFDLTASEMTGTRFHKGLVSMWVRMPSGYQFAYDKRTIFHGTFWERRDVSSDTTVPYITEEMIPYYFSCHIKNDPVKNDELGVKGLAHIGFNISRTFGGVLDDPDGYDLNNAPHPMWEHELQSVPFDFLIRPGEFDTAMNIPYGDRSTAETPEHPESARIWNTDFSSNASSDFFVRPMSSRSQPQHSFSFRPGGWVRVICGWDLGLPNDVPYARRANCLVQGGINNSTSLSEAQMYFFRTASKEQVQRWDFHDISYNPNMIWAFGETPSYVPINLDAVDDTYLTTQNNADDYNRVSAQGVGTPLEVRKVMPFGRLDSSIDNIVMHFGDTGGVDMGAMKTALQTNTTDPAFAVRYNLTKNTWVGHEPEFVFDPALKGSVKLYHLGLRVYDPPYEMHDMPAADPGMHEDIPHVKAQVYALDGASGALIGHSAIETPKLLGPSALKARHRLSRSYKLYKNKDVDEQLRIKVQFSSKRTWGGDVNDPAQTVIDAPWVKEISLKTWTPEPVITLWWIN